MTLEMDFEWLKKQKLFIATPCGDGKINHALRIACMKLTELLKGYQITHHYFDWPGDSLVTRVRNRLAMEFLKGSHTHMLWIDSDVVFEPTDVIAMLMLSKTYEGIIGGVYPKKQINWKRVWQAARQDIPPDRLASMAGDFVVNWIQERMPLDRPAEVREIGTGYMMVPRNVYEQLESTGAVKKFKMMPDEQARYKTEEGVAFFEALIDSETQHYLSEDYYFCRKWRSIGGKVWACLWMRTRHIGPMEYLGDIAAISEAGFEL